MKTVTAFLCLFFASFAFSATPITDGRFTGVLNSVQSGAVFTWQSGSTISVDAGATVTGLQRTNSTLTTLAGLTFSSYSQGLFPLTTRTAYFDAIAPNPTTGDVLYYNGTHWVDLGIGSTGQVLTVASGVPSWAGSAAGAPSNATYITQIADAGLSNEFALGSLGTGILKNATTTGVLSIATSGAGNDYVAPGAATTSGLTMTSSRLLGRTTASTGAIEELTFSGTLDQIGSTRGSILYRGSSGWAAATPGTSTYVWTSNGSGADPTWQAAAGGGFTNPMTTAGDMIIGGSSGTAVRLPGSGTDGFVATYDSASSPKVKWAAASATPAGSNTQIQFNNSSAFGASSNLTWGGSTSGLIVNGGVLAGNNPSFKITDANSAEPVWMRVEQSALSSSFELGVAGGSGQFLSDAHAGDGIFKGFGSGTLGLAFGGRGSGGAATTLYLVWSGSSAAGRVLVASATDDTTNALQVTGTVGFKSYGAGNIIADSSGNLTSNTGYVNSAIASGSSVSLTTATAANVTSISVPAGTWFISGNINFSAATATVTGTSGGISSTTATLPTDGTEVYSGVQVTLLSETDSVTLPPKKFTLGSTTTIYLVGRSTFSAGAVSAFGQITAQQVY